MARFAVPRLQVVGSVRGSFRQIKFRRAKYMEGFSRQKTWALARRLYGTAGTRNPRPRPEETRQSPGVRVSCSCDLKEQSGIVVFVVACLHWFCTAGLVPAVWTGPSRGAVRAANDTARSQNGPRGKTRAGHGGTRRDARKDDRPGTEKKRRDRAGFVSEREAPTLA